MTSVNVNVRYGMEICGNCSSLSVAAAFKTSVDIGTGSSSSVGSCLRHRSHLHSSGSHQYQTSTGSQPTKDLYSMLVCNYGFLLMPLNFNHIYHLLINLSNFINCYFSGWWRVENPQPAAWCPSPRAWSARTGARAAASRSGTQSVTQHIQVGKYRYR